MHTTLTDARGRLRTLAILAAKLDAGRTANRLSAYALVIGERPSQRYAMLADLEQLAQGTPNLALAQLLREACGVVRDVLRC